MAGTQITKKDLDDHLEKAQLANDRMTDLLKETALQFNNIVNQLMNLTKSNDSLLDLQKESQSAIVSAYEKSSQLIIKELEGINFSVHETSGKISRLREKIDKYETDRIKGNTKFIIIISVIAGLLTLATSLIKFIGN